MKEEIERTPLKIIIQNFLNHIENLESQKIEDSYEKEFQVIIFVPTYLLYSTHSQAYIFIVFFFFIF